MMQSFTKTELKWIGLLLDKGICEKEECMEKCNPGSSEYRLMETARDMLIGIRDKIQAAIDSNSKRIQII